MFLNMDSTTILHYLSESAYLIIVLSIFLTVAIIRGRQSIINHICGLYLALLLTIQFPYYNLIFKGLTSASNQAIAKLSFFLIVTVLTTLLFKRIMPEEYREGKFESFGKKIALAIGATILVMSFSFNVLPVTELLAPGTPIQSLFAPKEFFFGWLLLPLVILLIN